VVCGEKNWFGSKISTFLKLFSPRGKKLQRDFNVIAGRATLVGNRKEGVF